MTKNEFREKVQTEAYLISKNYSFCGLDISMRLGKTFLGLKIAKDFKKVLIIYPSFEIINSWKNEASKHNIDISNLYFVTFISLNNFKNLQDYDCIIVDEVHGLSENNLIYLLENHQFIKKIVGLSASFPTRGNKVKYINTLFPIKYTKTLEETTNITNKDYLINLYLIKPSLKKDILLKKGKFVSENERVISFTKRYYENSSKMNEISLITLIKNSKTKLEFCKKLAEKSERAIIFLETKKQCDDLGYHSYNSKDKNSKENLMLFEEQKINKLSCISQLSAGVTFENLKEAIVLHSYASESRLFQRIGRVLNYKEGEKGTIHICCLKGTIDEEWTKKALAKFNQEKIKIIEV